MSLVRAALADMTFGVEKGSDAVRNNAHTVGALIIRIGFWGFLTIIIV